MDEKEIKTMVLDAYLDREVDMDRFTSQDICDNLRDTISLTPSEVTDYMIEHGYCLTRQLDSLVWTKKTS